MLNARTSGLIAGMLNRSENRDAGDPQDRVTWPKHVGRNRLVLIGAVSVSVVVPAVVLTITAVVVSQQEAAKAGVEAAHEAESQKVAGAQDAMNEKDVSEVLTYCLHNVTLSDRPNSKGTISEMNETVTRFPDAFAKSEAWEYVPEYRRPRWHWLKQLVDERNWPKLEQLGAKPCPGRVQSRRRILSILWLMKVLRTLGWGHRRRQRSVQREIISFVHPV